MSDFDIRKAINFGWPDNQSRVGETYASLEWFGPGDKPTEAEVMQAWDDYLAAPPPAPVYPTEVIIQSPAGVLVRVTADDNGEIYGEVVA